MSRDRRNRNRRRERGRFAGLYRLVAIILILAAIVAASVIFFRVKEVVVRGNERYTADEIVEVTGIQAGENLLTVRGSRISRELRSKLPYIQTVSVRLRLPDTVLVTVEEGDIQAALQDGDRWWMLGAAGKLLEEKDVPGDYTAITGLDPLAPAPGTYLAVEEERHQKVAWLRELLDALEENGLLAGTDAIDMAEDYEIVFTCDGRFTVHLSPTLEKGMSYWLRRFAVYRADPAVEENQSYHVYIRDGEKLRFIPA